MTTLLIRPAAVSEGALLTDLAVRSKGHWGYGQDFLDRARPELTINEHAIRAGKVFVAARDARPVGVSILDVEADPPELTALFVDPDVIGQGVGSALLRHALGRARAAGVESILIESDPNAEPFYRSHGAAPEGHRRSPSTGRQLPLLRITTSEQPE